MNLPDYAINLLADYPFTSFCQCFRSRNRVVVDMQWGIVVDV